jgi:hypothetical protein
MDLPGSRDGDENQLVNRPLTAANEWLLKKILFKTDVVVVGSGLIKGA